MPKFLHKLVQSSGKQKHKSSKKALRVVIRHGPGCASTLLRNLRLGMRLSDRQWTAFTFARFFVFLSLSLFFFLSLSLSISLSLSVWREQWNSTGNWFHFPM